MLKLATLLLSSKSLTHRSKPLTILNRKVKPRFWWIILSIIVAILFIALWDELAPQSFATSVYWEGGCKWLHAVNAMEQ